MGEGRRDSDYDALRQAILREHFMQNVPRDVAQEQQLSAVLDIAEKADVYTAARHSRWGLQATWTEH